MIPKIIHYCWLSGDPIPERLQNYMKTWKEKLPDYEFMLWDKSRFDIHSMKWVEQAYAAKKYAFASDYIRLYAVYNYGGIYLDMDMEIIKAFDQEQFTKGVTWGLDESGDVEAAFLAGSGHNPVLKELMEWYERAEFLNPDGTLNQQVANVYVQNHLKQYGYVKENKEQMLEACDVKLFPADYFNCRSLVTGKLNVTENSCCIHWHTVLWASKTTKFIQWLRLKVLVPVMGEKNYNKLQKLFGRA